MPLPDLDDDLTYKIFKSLEADPSLSQRALSRSLGISLGKVNYCLKALAAKGWIKVRNFEKNPHKMGYLYLLTPAGFEAKARVTARFLRRKIREYETLKKEIEALRLEVKDAE
jgi:EPS-associated MarR family transcriptional regulator